MSAGHRWVNFLNNYTQTCKFLPITRNLFPSFERSPIVNRSMQISFTEELKTRESHYHTEKPVPGEFKQPEKKLPIDVQYGIGSQGSFHITYQEAPSTEINDPYCRL